MALFRGEWRSLLSVLVLILFVINAVSTQYLEETSAAGDAALVFNPDERDTIKAQRQEDDRSVGSKGVSASVVLINSVLMAAANCLGAVPFLFVKHLSKDVIGMANAVACGVMLACSFDLLHEGEEYGSILLLTGLLIGMCCVKWTQSYLERYETIRFEALEGADARKTMLVVGIMAAHAVGEGAGVGVSYSGDGGWTQGLLVTLAIGLHNVPEGLAVSTVLISRGVPLRRAILWNFASAIPQAIFALPAFLFVEMFKNCLPVALGFAAGCMIWVVFSELLPDAYDNAQPSRVATTATLSAVGLEAARMGMNAMEHGSFFSVGLDAVAFHHVTVAAMCFFVCVTFALLTGHLVPVKPFNIGIGTGMQCGLCLASLLRLFFRSSLPAFSCFLWVSLGCAVATVDWRNLFFRVSKKRRNWNSEENDCLPLIHQWSQASNFFWTHLMHDPVVAKLLWSLIGLGVADGICTGSSLQLLDSSWDSILIPAVVRTALFGSMLGLLLSQFRKHRSASLFLCGIISLVQGSTTLFMIYIEAQLSKPLMRFVALISGFVLLNGCRAVTSTEASLLRQGKATWMKPAPVVIHDKEEYVADLVVDAGHVHEVTSRSKSRVYYSLGTLFGLGITLSVLLMLEGLCKWTLHCSL